MIILQFVNRDLKFFYSCDKLKIKKGFYMTKATLQDAAEVLG